LIDPISYFTGTVVWEIAAPGSKDVQPFAGQFTVLPPVRITNSGNLAVIDHTHDLTIKWNGNEYSNDYTATIQVASQLIPFSAVLPQAWDS
jgi:hypothetical protein